MSENRRVVVTGIGAITPLGNSVSDTWENMKNGKNGIGSKQSWELKSGALIPRSTWRLMRSSVLTAMHSLLLQPHSRQ